MKLTMTATTTNENTHCVPTGAAALAAAAVMLLGTSVATAAEADAGATGPEPEAVQEIVVTGTRVTGMAAAESPAPIQILSADSLKAASGNPDVMQTLAQMIPSLTAQAFGNGGSNQTLMVKLKGLSPNHVLILVDGKRRHTTANLAVNASAYQGGAGADLNFIPLSAIDHIEVLTEGAAAQYGSDAIAGVINIILKKDSSGGTLTGTYGAFYDSGPSGATLPFHSNGATNALTANIGLAPADNAYLNLSAEVHNHDHTFRGAQDPRTTAASALASSPDSNMLIARGYPYLNWILGDADSHSKLFEFNGGYDFGGGLEFYSFGTYGTKSASSYQNYRQPHVAHYTNTTTGVTTYLYPLGFEPIEADDEVDYAATAGLKGHFGDWRWDLSSTYGRDRHDIYTLDSVNTTIYSATGMSVTDFYDGQLVASQWTSNLDIDRDFDIGLAGPLNLAIGVEYRRDTYTTGEGEPESWKSGGAAANAGFSTADSGTHSRNNVAGYVDIATQPIEKLRVDLAGRFEHFSDFGNTAVGKLTGRYDFSPKFALRGTVSDGFRAPTLAEEYYSSISVGPSSISAQLPPNGAAAAVLGLGDLKPEKSTNVSLGMVMRPLPGMSTTLDLYHIRVTNRIVGSGTLYGTLNGNQVSPLINNVLDASGISATDPAVTSTGINLFTNGINTTTNGADLAFDFPMQYDIGNVDWSIGGTYNHTSVTYIKPLNGALVSALNGSPVYSLSTLANISETSPRYIANLGAHWTYGNVSLNLLEKIYGASSGWASDTNNVSGTRLWYKTTIGVTPITNLDLAYQFPHGLAVDVGANNLFNRYPPHNNAQQVAADNSSYAVTRNSPAAAYPYPIFSPFGIDGGFYYVRATLTF